MERRAGSGVLLDRAGVAEGMRVLDVGCGPGRLSIPAAGRVGPEGLVVAMDIQEAMLEKLRARAAERGITNLRIVHADIGEGRIERDFFDRALMVTVLGEVRDRERALEEIFAELKPGGVLSITEVLPDPDYQPREKVRRLAEAAGFEEAERFGTLFAFTINFVRPRRPGESG
jgi:ubiquinone/menaquinone biosynthesis C-methylase UbiE